MFKHACVSYLYEISYWLLRCITSIEAVLPLPNVMISTETKKKITKIMVQHERVLQNFTLALVDATL